MIMTIIAILVVLWLIGLIAHAGGLIWLLLVAAGIIYVFDMITGRHSRV
jgi:hypothetical protein